MLTILSLLAVGDASAFDYVTSTVGRFGRDSGLVSVAMSDSGDFCFTRYGTAGSGWYFQRRGAGAPTTLTESADGYLYCVDVTDSGYALAYETGGSEVAGLLYDGLTDELYEMDNGGAGYAYATMVNENGYSSGYIQTTDGYGYRAAWWGPTGEGPNEVSVAGHDTSYPLGIDEWNRVLAYGQTSSRWGVDTDVLLYDIDRGTAQAFGAELPSGASVGFAADGDVITATYGGGPILKYDFDADDLDVLPTRPFDTNYVYGTNAAGDVLLTSYSPDGSYRAWCWNETWGAVELEGSDSTYAYAAYLNDAGLAVGYVYGADGSMETAGWDCSTGERVDVPSPSSSTYVYPTGLTEDGLVFLYAYDGTSPGYTVWVADVIGGQLRKVAGDGGSSSAYLYGYSAETGDALVYHYQRGVGRLDYLRRVD